jgi:hypothetical protein
MAPPLRILIVFGADMIVPLAVIAGLVPAIPTTSDRA